MEDILAAFKSVYKDILADPELLRKIQNVKDALYNRDYVKAFGTKENLEAYIVRWTPPRSLAYSHIFSSLAVLKTKLSDNANVLAIGAGAGAELVALSQFKDAKVTIIDRGDWQPVVQPLAEHFQMDPTFIYDSVLSAQLDYSQYNFISCLFTTNELFAESKTGAMDLLRRLSACPKGALLVMIESAGSYSEIQVGSKKFPVYFLVHHVLTLQNNWSLVESTDSEWFRVPKELHEHYSLKLENLRYFSRVYQRQ